MIDDLHQRLLAVIERGADAPLPSEEFQKLAFDVFAYQYRLNPTYRSYCDARSVNPGVVRRLSEIPAVPTDAFKVTALLCGDPADAAAVFRTSGTTGGAQRRGTHYLLDTDLYRASLLASFRRHLLSDHAAIRIASLVPAPDAAPDSSLSFMIGAVVEEMGALGSGFFVSGDGLDLDGFQIAVEEAIEADAPLLVVGTSFAFVHLLDWLAARDTFFQLPQGSRAMDTGGFKGRSREVSRGELYDSIRARLGIPISHIVNEYGMTEMSSQFYDGIVGTAKHDVTARHHEPAPWLHAEAVDPETLTPLPDGEVGILRYLDLANLYSVFAIQTADWGRVVEGRVELHGRAVGAEPRGCSIAVDELLEALDQA